MDLLGTMGRDAIIGVAVTVSVLCLMITLEFILPSRRKYSALSRLKGIGFWVIFAVVASVINFGLRGLWRALGYEPALRLHSDQWFGWAGPAAVVLAVIAAAIFSDFFAYWYHRIQHGPLWRFHAVHHSIEELHAVNSFGHPLEEVFKFALMFVPMSFISLGRDTETPLVMATLLVLQPYYTHSPMRFHFGPLRYIWSCPRAWCSSPAVASPLA
jgi:sterol desaturase/sphingolipid hydroxylase (fatty acid hydroxylase superfamily)